jgi:DNA-binding NarL/FixJ family response regulator
MKPRTLIAHDHPLFVSGLERMLAVDFDIVGTMDVLQSLPEAVERLRPDVVLQGLFSTPSMGLATISQIHQSTPDTRIIVVTRWPEGEFAVDAFRRGASAYLHLTSTEAELREAIHATVSRKPFVSSHLAMAAIDALVGNTNPALTPRQSEVVRLLVQGKSMKEAAAVLNMSTRTVAFHKYDVMRRLHMTSTAELVRFAVNQRLV